MRSFAVAASLSAAALVLSFAPTAASRPAPASAPAAGPGAVLSMHVHMLRALDAGDTDKIASYAIPTDESLSFLPGPNGRIERVAGTAAVNALQDWANRTGDEGWTTKITDSRSDCYSEELSWAVLEFERTRETEKGTITQRFQSTSLVSYSGGGWKLRHINVAPAGANYAVPPTKKALAR